MKKNLFCAVLFILLGNLIVAQQSKQSEVLTATSQNPINQNQPGKHSRNAPVAPTSTTSTCASLNYPAPSTWTLQSYSYATGSGYVNGTNIYGDKEKAAYFDASASTFSLVNQVYVHFAVGKGTNLNKVVSMIIYDGTSGTPGAAIGTSSMTLGDIKADIAGGYYSSFIFSGGVPLPASKKFFASVDLSALTWNATVKDSLNIVSNKNGQSYPSPTWERASNNSWYQYATAGATTASVSLVIHPFLTNNPSSATFSVSANPVCVNQGITYDATGTAYDASNASNLLLWTFAGPVGTSTLQSNMTPARTYTSAGTYTTVLEVLGGGCSVYEYAIKTITVNPNPVVTATSPSTVCLGNNATLNGGGATTYTWTGGVTNGQVFSPTNSSTYTVTGTDLNGCVNTATTSVTVANPTVTANTTATAVCEGSNVTLTGGGAVTYTWTGSVTDGVAFAPTSTNTYTVTGTDINGCGNTATVAVNVNTLPTVTANTTATAVCAGTNITLTGGGASTYTWTGSVNNGVAFAPASTDTYTVTGTDANGCTNTAIASVTVNSLPNVTANTTATVVCEGSNITLTGGGASTYTWTGSVNDGVAFAPASTDTYTVTGTDANGCENTAVVSVTVNSAPSVTANSTATMVCTGDNITLTGGGATTYTWSGSVADGVSFVPTATDTYTVTGEDANGCTATATVEVVVDLCTGVKNLAKSAGVMIYPNPNNGSFTIRSSVNETISIVNELGQVIDTAVLNSANNFSYKAENLQSGIYFVVGTTSKVKVIVAH